MNSSALITGITGQDGSYLSELLLAKGYTVHAIIRRSSSFNTGRINHVQHTGHQVRFYQAGSSEMFGGAAPPQNELTPFYPPSPYAVSKVVAHWYAVNYREAYKLFVCNGILFNHESPRRGETFVTRKLTRAVGRNKAGLQKKLYLGISSHGATGALPATTLRPCG